MLIFIFSLVVAFAGETLYAPQFCHLKSLQIELINTLHEEIDYTLIASDGKKIEALQGRLSAKQKDIVSGSEFMFPKSFFYLHTENKALKAFVHCQGRFPLLPETPLFSSYKYERAQISSVSLQVLNLHYLPQDFSVTYRDDLNKFIHKVELTTKAYGISHEYLLHPPPNTAFIEVEFQFKNSSYLIDLQKQSRIAAHQSYSKMKTQKMKNYFLVEDTEQSESFIFSTDDQKIIEEARAHLRSGSPKIVSALARRSQSSLLNRNLSSSQPRLWSWHVDKVLGFGDLGSTSCAGWPSLLEDSLPFWGQEEKTICFWNYYLKRELKENEVDIIYSR